MGSEKKLALITGASRGIGKAIALELASNGFRVIGTATSEKGAENISQYLKENGYDGIGMVLNVVDDESINRLMNDIKDQFHEPITVLVNNAGITHDNLLIRMKQSEWDDIIATNLSSVFKMSREVLRPMIKNKWGRIVTIGSVVGSTGNPGQANYAAAKAGLTGFSKSLASEIGSRGITVNVVSPGFIDTDMTKALNENQRDALIKKIPAARLGTPEDIARAVAFLCSDGAAYITGETLHVNGGMFMA